MLGKELIKSETSLVQSPDLLSKEKIILKKDIEVLPIWFGQRLLTNSDFGAFQDALRHRTFSEHSSFMIPEANDMEEADRKALSPMAEDLLNLLNSSQKSLVVFVVSTASSAEHIWLNQFPGRLQEFGKSHSRRSDIFVFNLIMGGSFKECSKVDPENCYSRYEKRAHELGGVYLSYNTDAPTAGSRRLVEFMERVLGNDLPGEDFPRYSEEEIRKIAWNINREDFNGLWGLINISCCFFSPLLFSSGIVFPDCKSRQTT